MTIHLLVLQNLLRNCLNIDTEEYKPNRDELFALRWFLYQTNKGEFARLELLKQAVTLGIEPEELLAVGWLAERLIVRRS